MRWLLLIPFYVFTAIGVFLVLSMLCRILRLKLSANALAITSVAAGIAFVLLPLLEGITLADYSGLRLLALAGVTFLLATLDTLLEPLLPLPIDRELSEF